MAKCSAQHPSSRGNTPDHPSNFPIGFPTPPNHYLNTTKYPPKHHRWNPGPASGRGLRQSLERHSCPLCIPFGQRPDDMRAFPPVLCKGRSWEIPKILWEQQQSTSKCKLSFINVTFRTMIAFEEKEIRTKLSSRTSDLLKKVFALQD